VTVTRLESSDASFVYTGAGWGTISDASASGGNYRGTVANGDSVTITVAAASGYTGFLIGYTSQNGAFVPTITVDGVASGSIAQTNTATTSNVGAFIYQRLSPPFSFVGNGAHTIVLVAAGGGMTIDFIEYYTAELPVPRRCTTFGHSITAGYGLAAPAQTRFGTLVANAFNLVDDNFGVSSEDLTNGNNRCNGVLTDSYASQTIVLTSVTSGNFNLVYTPAAAGVAPITIANVPYNASTTVLAAAINTALNVLAPGINAVTVSAPGGALPLNANIIAFTGNAQPFRGAQAPFVGSSGSPPLVGGVVSIGGTYVVGSQQWNALVPVPGWTRAWNGTSAIGDNWFGRRPELALVMHGLNDCGYSLLLDPTFGAGYGAERFKARIRELNWRMNLNCPNTQIIHCGVCYDNVPADGSFNPLRRQYSTYLGAACADPTCKNVTYVETWIPTVNNGRDALMFAPPGVAQGHPNEVGHEVIAREVIAAARVLRGHASVRLGL
jgi:lysophospholipase L1-like esterase